MRKLQQLCKIATEYHPWRIQIKSQVLYSPLMMIWFGFSNFFLTISSVYAQDTPKPAAGCTGWMCGAKEAIKASPAFASNATAGTMIDLAFIALQFVVVIVVGYLVVNAIILFKRNEDYSGSAGSAVVAVIALIASNYLADYIVGTATGG